MDLVRRATPTIRNQLLQRKANEELILDEIFEAIVFPGVLFTIGMGFLFDWLDRKTAARMQGRIGPKITGPSGILQPLADFLKLLFKEEVIPSHADKVIFLFAPALYFLAPLLSMLFIPILGLTPTAGFDYDILAILFLLAYAAFVVAILSYSSASSFTTVATGRLVLQYVSYEIPLVLAIITAVLYTRNLSVEGIVAAQSRVWNIFVMPFAFAVYVIAFNIVCVDDGEVDFCPSPLLFLHSCSSPQSPSHLWASPFSDRRNITGTKACPPFIRTRSKAAH